MRGTLHIVAATDARSMLELMTPRIVASIAQTFLRRFDLDENAIAQSKELFERALQGGKRLIQETATGQTYWLASSMPDTKDPSSAA